MRPDAPVPLMRVGGPDPRAWFSLDLVAAAR